MIGLPGRIFQAGEDVIEFDGRVIAQDFSMVGPGAEKLQDIDHAHPSSTQARPTTALARFDRDAFEQIRFVVHDALLVSFYLVTGVFYAWFRSCAIQVKTNAAIGCSQSSDRLS